MATRAHTANWAPLERLVTFVPVQLADFMWMYSDTTADGTEVQAYKHRDTRRYLFLDSEARAYNWSTKSGFEMVHVEDALRFATTF